MSLSQLQSAITHYRQQLKAHEAQAEQALEQAYAQVLSTIQPMLDQLYQQISDKLDAGEEIPLSWLYEQRRLEAISQYIEGQINHFGMLAQMQVGQLQQQAVQLGQQAAQWLLQATVPTGIQWSFGIPSPSALAQFIGATQVGSPLADLFSGFGAEAAQGVKDALITGLSLGYNPRDIAPSVQQALGISRNRALTISRTEMIRSYRGANLETYRANDDVVDGWIWNCAFAHQFLTRRVGQTSWGRWASTPQIYQTHRQISRVGVSGSMGRARPHNVRYLGQSMMAGAMAISRWMTS